MQTLYLQNEIELVSGYIFRLNTPAKVFSKKCYSNYEFLNLQYIDPIGPETKLQLFARL